jgi:hypothetical protein
MKLGICRSEHGRDCCRVIPCDLSYDFCFCCFSCSVSETDSRSHLGMKCSGMCNSALITAVSELPIQIMNEEVLLRSGFGSYGGTRMDD